MSNPYICHKCENRYTTGNMVSFCANCVHAQKLQLEIEILRMSEVVKAAQEWSKEYEWPKLTDALKRLEAVR